jgi:hypothetical protein
MLKLGRVTGSLAQPRLLHTGPACVGLRGQFYFNPTQQQNRREKNVKGKFKGNYTSENNKGRQTQQSATY